MATTLITSESTFRAWLGQVTTGHGAAVLGPTLMGWASGQLTSLQALPMVVGSVVLLAWPENTALAQAAEAATTDLEHVANAYLTGAQHAAAAVAGPPAVTTTTAVTKPAEAGAVGSGTTTTTTVLTAVPIAAVGDTGKV